jgi:hypothetical protein
MPHHKNHVAEIKQLNRLEFREGAGQRMLKMKDGPTICLKTQTWGTKCPPLSPVFWTKIRPSRGNSGQNSPGGRLFSLERLRAYAAERSHTSLSARHRLAGHDMGNPTLGGFMP